MLGLIREKTRSFSPPAVREIRSLAQDRISQLSTPAFNCSSRRYVNEGLKFDAVETTRIPTSPSRSISPPLSVFSPPSPSSPPSPLPGQRGRWVWVPEGVPLNTLTDRNITVAAVRNGNLHRPQVGQQMNFSPGRRPLIHVPVEHVVQLPPAKTPEVLSPLLKPQPPLPHCAACDDRVACGGSFAAQDATSIGIYSALPPTAPALGGRLPWDVGAWPSSDWVSTASKSLTRSSNLNNHVADNGAGQISSHGQGLEITLASEQVPQSNQRPSTISMPGDIGAWPSDTWRECEKTADVAEDVNKDSEKRVSSAESGDKGHFPYHDPMEGCTFIGAD